MASAMKILETGPGRTSPGHTDTLAETAGAIPWEDVGLVREMPS